MTKLTTSKQTIKAVRPGYDKPAPGSRRPAVRGFSGMYQLPVRPGWRRAGYYNTPA